MDIKTIDTLCSDKTMKGRKAPPSHYTFKIKSFSWLSKASVQKCTSEEFEAGGYKWSLSIYPDGNKKEGGKDHVSIDLVLVDTSSRPLDWEINAIVNFSAYNFIDDEYHITQDTDVRRFHVLKTECGVAKFIDRSTFYDSSNGYLMDDTCVFGVEVFVVKSTNRGDCLSMFEGPIPCSYTWKFTNFSSAKLDKYESETFVGGNYKWKLLLYPNGIVEGKGNSVSLFLVLDVSTLPANTKLVVENIVRAKNQKSDERHLQTKACRKFSNSNAAWGSRQLVALAKLKDPNSGFLVDDTCVFETEFTILGVMMPRTD
ncbi:uncharacterized protein LOC114195958 isoform X2 [Vigna unguiculata]|uniref:uncharacterized protein LOC114195958 isoform X2 n=1 Tax=Vigna unguiculata TaxID=3917 RepID=UPI001016F222|nr:uncharacterized protein LOC114195958 isoform X2 [Vigna unguiculata]